jgi:hypothetical protein
MSRQDYQLEDSNDDYTADQGREEYIKDMEDLGYKIIYPKINELQVDLDSEKDYQKFDRQLKSILKEYPDVEYTVKPSRNGLPGRHATVTMPFEMNDAERIAWQAALGSDPFRELMSLFRLRRGDSFPTLFVEKNESETEEV